MTNQKRGDRTPIADDVTYLTAPAVRHLLGGISDMTLWRWMHDDQIGFPKPFVISRRRYFREDQVIAFVERSSSLYARYPAISAAARPPAVKRITSLEAALAPLARIGSELLRAEGEDSWKAEIPDDKVIFSFCGAGVTAGDLRTAARLIEGKAPHDT